MHPRIFAIITAFLLGALGLGAVAVTHWAPTAPTAAGSRARGSTAARAVGASPTGDPAVWTRSTLRNKLMAEMDSSDPGVALADLDKITKAKPYTVRFCHPIAHELGHTAVKRYNYDFAKVLSFPHDTCASGYLHGAVEEMLAASTDPTSDLLKLCQPQMSGPCVHGTGHGTMYVTKQNVPAARDLCSEYSSQNRIITCSEGLFMQLFAPDEEDENAKANLPADKLAAEPLYPCPEQPALFQSACYFYAPTYFLSSHDYPNHPEVFAQALQWCLKAQPTGGAGDCSRGVGSRTMKYNLDREDWVGQQCASAAEAWQRKSCVDGMVSYYTVNYTDPGASGRLCAKLTNQEIARDCRSSAHLSGSLD